MLSRLGARLALSGRNAARLEETRASLEGTGHEVSPLDLSRGDDIHAWQMGLTSRIGPLDGLVHAAGIQNVLPLKMVDRRDIDNVLQVNVRAAVMLAKGFRHKGVHSDRSSIVPCGRVVSFALFRKQGGHRGAHEIVGAGIGRREDPRQQRGSCICPNADVRCRYEPNGAGVV